MSNIKICGFGGDGFDDIENKMNEYIKKNGGSSHAVQGYGSSEAMVATRCLLYKPGSLGKPTGKVKIAIFEPDTEIRITEPNVVGEIAVSGDNVTLGYYNDPKRTADVYRQHADGRIWVHMGDLGCVDEDGFLFYHGRIKNIIKRKSFAFSPQEIIDAIMKHENVKSCMVIPRYSKEEGETPSAHIVLNDYSDTDKTLEEIKALVDENVQEFHRPTHYKIRQAIPLTKNNKNNITALKIEDTSTMFDGILSADIEAHNTSEYEFLLKVKIKSDKSEDEIIEALEKHINKIASIIKFNVGKIKYEIEKV